MLKNLGLHYLATVALLIRPVLCGDVVGRLVVGYQGWFGCGQDLNDPYKRWVHWGNGTAEGVTFELWPDVREYESTYQWNYDSVLGDGQPSKLYDSYDDQTIDTHFKWMQEYNIDTATLQRFGSNLAGSEAPHLNGIAPKVAEYSQKHGRKWYITWDISGWTNFTTDLPADWTNYVKSFTETPSYAKERGKPVVAVWGMGVSGRPGTPEQVLSVIEFLQEQGCFVIGGTEAPWRNLTNFYPTFQQLDALQPWNVGTFSGIEGAAADQPLIEGDLAWCNENNVVYQPVIFPGFSWHNLKGGPINQIPRLHGDFMWQQFVNMREYNISTVYIAMFDEFDEGTAIAKAAEDASMAPTDHYFLTLDIDGPHLSSDFYLRVAQDGRSMITGETPLVSNCPTPFTV